MQDIQDQPSTKNVVVNFIQSGWSYIQGLFSKLSSGLQSTIEDGIPMFDGISVNPFDTEMKSQELMAKMKEMDERLRLDTRKQDHLEQMDKARLAFDKDKAAKDFEIKRKQANKKPASKWLSNALSI